MYFTFLFLLSCQVQYYNSIQQYSTCLYLQAKAKITLLQEQHHQMTDAISLADTAINTGDVSAVPDWSLSIEPEFRDPVIKKLIMVNGSSPTTENTVSISLSPLLYFYLIHLHSNFSFFLGEQ